MSPPPQFSMLNSVKFHRACHPNVTLGKGETKWGGGGWGVGGGGGLGGVVEEIYEILLLLHLFCSGNYYVVEDVVVCSYK